METFDVAYINDHLLENMYKSKEIRWFSESLNHTILNWFTSNGLNFDRSVSRTDFYLPLAKEEINVKLREGNIEIKHRTRPPVPGRLTLNAEGIFEEWIKWSLNLSETDRLSTEITQGNIYQWTEIVKNRIGLKLKNKGSGSGRPQILSINEIIASGCQMEYTQLTVNKKNYYTFALEWFGESHLHLNKSFLDSVLGDAVLKPEKSMGYARFLKLLQQESSVWQ